MIYTKTKILGMIQEIDQLVNIAQMDNLTWAEKRGLMCTIYQSTAIKDLAANGVFEWADMDSLQMTVYANLDSLVRLRSILSDLWSTCS